MGPDPVSCPWLRGDTMVGDSTEDVRRFDGRRVQRVGWVESESTRLSPVGTTVEGVESTEVTVVYSTEEEECTISLCGEGNVILGLSR